MRYLIVHTGQPIQAQQVEDKILLENINTNGKILSISELYLNSFKILESIDKLNLVVLISPGEPEMFLAGFTDAALLFLESVARA